MALRKIKKTRSSTLKRSNEIGGMAHFAEQLAVFVAVDATEHGEDQIEDHESTTYNDEERENRCCRE